ncbi:hypothetical protein CANARDRAFT_9139 [[Candida] arabinofermentans NRRL YB-2248]|uniref:Peptidase M16 N-terminal domain-containing protein n=1 Tax=[Candida] arabinofermentans NRRL YB-2248 TaxID=983967 RepID=A0A1E4SWI6_9ASCO|nr:hypothetical protein CANARDRAFT_9139 [[Candida] arabinofermentans NRRL YB-2248]
MSNLAYKVISDNIHKPDIDNRDYRLIQLENDLTALLISDPTTDKSAAALDVNVGAFHDPKNLPGLAHFCEHLLFMGTEKYPSENEYSSYLSKNSGFSNAFTSAQHTNYYFEVTNDAMEGALDRFSQFFISPLFDPSCKDREINAVDSENKKNLQNDTWRLYQLSKSLTNIDHPYNGFSTGNKETLGDEPLKMGLDVRAELLKFHDQYYSSNLMRLVIISNESLETLQDWAVDKFSDVTNKNLELPFYHNTPFKPQDFDGVFVQAKPIMESRSLQLVFPVPDNAPYWQYAPTSYLSHLLGHESKGSLLFNFKKNGWANGLSCGSVNISSGFSEFVLEIELTPEGLKHYEEIIVDVFKYVKMLQVEGPQEWIYKEIHEESISSFKFRQKTGASSTASNLAGSLHYLKQYDTKGINPLKNVEKKPAYFEIPPENLLSVTIVRDYSPEYIKEFLSYINPSNFRATLVAKEPFESKEIEISKEKWYGTEYTVSKFSSPLMNSLNEIFEENLLDPNYTLPEKNDFIATDFSLVEKPKDESLKIIYPTLIKTNEHSKVWYKVNTKLGGPRSAVTLKFNLPGSTSTPLNSVLLALFIELLDDELNSVSYLASMAGLRYNFNVAREGISLDVNGFSHKLENLLDRVVDTLVGFCSPDDNDNVYWGKVREERFNVIREKMLRNLKNFGYSVPYNQVGPMISGLINEGSWLTDDQIACYDAVSFKTLKNYASNLFTSCFIEFLFVGNYTKSQVINLTDVIETKLKNSITLTDSQFTRGRSLYLPNGEIFHYIKPNDDPKNINSCIEIFLQLGEIVQGRDRILAELVAQILHEPFFNRLRTREQLGYVVFSGLRETRTTFGLRLLVQSERSTNYLSGRIEKFLKKMDHTIGSMSEAEFTKQVEAVISKKLQQVKNLKEERSRFWHRIATGVYDFDRREVDVEVLRSLKLDELILYYKNKILKSDNHGDLTVHLQSQVVPKQTQKIILTHSLSNFLYDYPEFDDLEVNWMESIIDSLYGASDAEEIEINEELILSIINHENFKKNIPEFKYTDELVSFVLSELKHDYNTVSRAENESVIETIGEWKCEMPLTRAPTAKILKQYLDDDLVVESKL